MDDRVEQYRQLVLQYEELDEVIDELFTRYGTSKDMPPDVLKRYWELAHQRDALQNDMRLLERDLAIDEDDAP